MRIHKSMFLLFIFFDLHFVALGQTGSTNQRSTTTSIEFDAETLAKEYGLKIPVESGKHLSRDECFVLTAFARDLLSQAKLQSWIGVSVKSSPSADQDNSEKHANIINISSFRKDVELCRPILERTFPGFSINFDIQSDDNIASTPASSFSASIRDMRPEFVLQGKNGPVFNYAVTWSEAKNVLEGFEGHHLDGATQLMPPKQKDYSIQTHWKVCEFGRESMKDVIVSKQYKLKLINTHAGNMSDFEFESYYKIRKRLSRKEHIVEGDSFRLNAYTELPFSRPLPLVGMPVPKEVRLMGFTGLDSKDSESEFIKKLIGRLAVPNDKPRER